MRVYNDFKEFYSFYLREHSLPLTKLIHFIGSLGSLICLILSFFISPFYLLLAPLFGYGLAWFSHFFIEHNRPATFTYPLWSFMGDWLMFYEVLKGRHQIFSFKLKREL